MAKSIKQDYTVMSNTLCRKCKEPIKQNLVDKKARVIRDNVPELCYRCWKGK